MIETTEAEFRAADILNFFQIGGEEKEKHRDVLSSRYFWNLIWTRTKFPTSYEFSTRECFPRANGKNRVYVRNFSPWYDVGKFFERNHGNLTFGRRREAEVRFGRRKTVPR